MEQTAKKSQLSPYFYLLILILQYLTAGFCQYKLQPILTYLMEGMSISEASAGFLLGTFFTTNYVMLFISQLIVGIGICGTGILGPYIIACLFKPELRGRANGWYITGGTIAQLLMYNLVPRITTVDDVTPAWWFTTVYGIVILVIWILFITDEVAPPMNQEALEKGEKSAHKLGLVDALKDPKVLQLCIGGFAFMMSTMAILSFTPTYLTLGRNYDPVIASSLVSVAAIVGAFSTAIGGTLSDLLKTRKWIYFGALMWMCISRLLIVILPDGILLNLVIWGQGIPSVAMGLIYTVAGENIAPEKTSVGMSAINMFIGLGGLFATALFGVFADAFGYTVTFVIFAVITLFGLIGVNTIKGVK